MIFIIATLILVLAIAFFHTIQGTFSALIMTVLTILSAALAVNFYAPLSHAYLLPQIPDYADACCLAGLFFITLVVLRSIIDNVVRGNILLYPLLDRILAGGLSIVTAWLLVGMGSIAFQMLPFDQQVLMFNRFDDQGRRVAIFPKADDFAAWMIATLSSNSLSSQTPFGMLHPDWPGELSAQRIAVQHESRHAVPPNTAKVLAAWTLDQPLIVKEYGFESYGYRRKPAIRIKDKRLPARGYYYLAVRLQLDAKAADEDGYHRFAWGQVRLVGFPGRDVKHENPVNYYLMGFKDLDVPDEWNYIRTTVPVVGKEDEDVPENELPRRNLGVVSRQTGAQVFEVVFEIPTDFQPWFLEYKRWARTLMPPIGKEPSLEGEAQERPAAQAQGPPAERVARRGWRSQYQIDYDRTAFTNELPFPLTAAANARRVGTDDAELTRMQYARGTLHGTIGRNQADDLDSKTPARFAVVKEFFVPSDKVLFRLECRIDPAQTELLRNIFGSVENIAQRYVVDGQGNRYFPVGQYAVVQQEGGSTVELQYDPEPTYTGGYGKPFRYVNPTQAPGRAVQVGFLFLVNHGTALDRFEVGGTPIEAQNLQGYTAP